MATVGLAGCEKAVDSEIVATVGNHSITVKDLEGWMRVISPGHVVPDAPSFTSCIKQKSPEVSVSVTALSRRECIQQYQNLRAHALSFLIHCEWFVAEAARRRLKVSTPRARDLIASMRGALIAQGATEADVELKAGAELAASMLRRESSARSYLVGRAEIAAFYRKHPQIARPEWRYFEIAEGLSLEQADELLHASTHHSGPRPTPFFTEKFPRSSIAAAEGQYKVLRQAIFSSPPHLLSGPVMLNGLYTVFEVTRVTPARVRSLRQSATSIEKMLRERRLKQLPLPVLRASRSRWRVVTSCRPGYVVRPCRQYQLPGALEDELEAETEPIE